MINSKKFYLDSARKDNDIERTTKEINEFFTQNPQYKVINIEHIYEAYSASFCYICVWYTDNSNY